MLMPRTIDPKNLERPCLVTIPYSHYCELSRWALERVRRKANRRSDLNSAFQDHCESGYVLELAPGYNCQGYVNIGPARTKAIFDTGASNIMIDKSYLTALLNGTSNSESRDPLGEYRPDYVPERQQEQPDNDHAH